MKKLLLTLAVVGVSAAAFAQGTVNFGNRVTFTTSPAGNTARPVYGTDWNGVHGAGATGALANRPAGTAYKSLLYMAIGAGQAEGTLLPTTATAARTFLTAGNAGFWSGETSRPLVTSGATAVQGNTVTLQVRVWDATAADYDAAVAAGKARGKSLTFNYTITTNPTPAPSDFYMENFQSFGLIVPEPTTYALGMLGLGLAWIIRRKK